MQTINAISLTSDVTRWLANSNRPLVLHVFDQACNLINERKEVLSVVAPKIGNGPFNSVVDTDNLFSKHLNLESCVSILASQLRVGNLLINTTGGKLWNPCPDWNKLYANRETILNQLQGLDLQKIDCATGFANADRFYSMADIASMLSELSSGLAGADGSTAKTITSKLAGLGVGLTPAGDDFIMGALYAVWIIHPREVAPILAKEVSETATPLTTSLSAAWLRSAGKGEAGILWHDLFNALIVGDDIQTPIGNLLAVGETSGADALLGFLSVCGAFKERIIDACPS